ncbi:hypothetical protein BJ878DRAFT_319761 [Calycina marina]|uniref:Peptide hydrolase n=1 Tax=Calycina marina TaxID=1763456 RepID=A0A9P8CG97_9HELO|nr:hypothetical protein BJ878DRAFT_319761 [Calycina marina]
MYHLASLLALSAVVAATNLGQRPLVDHQTSALKKNLVSSEALEALILEENLLKRAEDLYKIAELGIEEYNHPTRVVGSPGHYGTVDYIYKTIADLDDYYTLSNQTFNAVVGTVFEARLVIGDREPLSANPFALTPPTYKKEPVFGDLVLVKNWGCEASDYPKGVKGAIALIVRGTCSFGDKSALAGKAGAVAAVIYNDQPFFPLSGTLGSPSPDHVATFGISNEDAMPYIMKLKDGKEVDASAYIDSIVTDSPATNVIAQTKGGDQDNCVMVGAHSDSVSAGPGINDDGSGTISLLEVATHLTNFNVNNCVRFAWWAGEEEGLLGSDYYVSQLSPDENIKIRIFMDYDMMASPNFAYQIYDANNKVNPVGSEELRELYKAWYTKNGLNYTMIPFDGRSDYDAFIKNGIPGGGIATGAEGVKTPEEETMFGGEAGVWYDPCYHQLCDDVSNLAMDAFIVNTKAHSIATYAWSLNGFPKRVASKSEEATPQNSLPDAYRAEYHGPHLII